MKLRKLKKREEMEPEVGQRLLMGVKVCNGLTLKVGIQKGRRQGSVGFSFWLSFQKETERRQ
jgi:hypothetical protein